MLTASILPIVWSQICVCTTLLFAIVSGVFNMIGKWDLILR